MDNLDKWIEFAPIILVILLYIYQNNLFVKPDQLEKKHREILEDVKKDYVELNAYKEFQNRVLNEIESIKESVSTGFDDVRNLLKK